MVRALWLLLLHLPMAWAYAAEPRDLGQAKVYLEGAWLIGERPDAGDCKNNHYHSEQWELEFRKSGGRILRFEPPDLYTAIQIERVEAADGLIRLLLQPPDRSLPSGVSRPPIWQGLRRIDDARMQLTDATGKAAGTFAYRCGAPNLEVNSSVTLTELSILTPVHTGSRTLIAMPQGESEQHFCDGLKTIKERPGGLQFEVYGPVSFWLFGDLPDQSRWFEFDTIMSIRKVSHKTLRISLHSQPTSKAPGPHDYVLTVRDTPGGVRIQELSTTFARCPGIFGMQRW